MKKLLRGFALPAIAAAVLTAVTLLASGHAAVGATFPFFQIVDASGNAVTVNAGRISTAESTAVLARLNNATGTGCTSISTTPTEFLTSEVNPTGTATGATATLYDEGASPTCVSADALVSFPAIAANTYTNFMAGAVHIQTTNGLAIQFGVAPAAGSAVVLYK